jgi:hypothetical protein
VNLWKAQYPQDEDRTAHSGNRKNLENGLGLYDQDEEVEFEVAESPKGLQAINVCPKRK